MTTAHLKEALSQPRPFTLFLTDGRNIDLPHAEFVWFPPERPDTIIIARPERAGIEILRINQIVSIRFPESTAS